MRWVRERVGGDKRKGVVMEVARGEVRVEVAAVVVTGAGRGREGRAAAVPLHANRHPQQPHPHNNGEAEVVVETLRVKWIPIKWFETKQKKDGRVQDHDHDHDQDRKVTMKRKKSFDSEGGGCEETPLGRCARKDEVPR